MAEQLGSDERLAASIIVLSTLFAVFSLAGSLIIQ
jgi:predicted permease